MNNINNLHNSKYEENRYTAIQNLKIIILLQRLRRAVTSNHFLEFTPDAKLKQKQNNKLITSLYTKFMNKVEQIKPFNINNWKNFYEQIDENYNKFKYNYNKDNKKIKLISETSIYIGETNFSNEKDGYGGLTNSKGEMFKGIWTQNKLKGWCRVIVKDVMIEGN